MGIHWEVLYFSFCLNNLRNKIKIYHSEPNYDQQLEASRRKYAFEQSRHFIHPAFGKRSTDRINTPEEEFNLKYHRTSRQTMYQKIAKFLDT